MHSFKQLSVPNAKQLFFNDVFVPDKKRGFLPKCPLKELPEYSYLHKELNRIAKNLPDLISKKQLRIEIDTLNKQFSESADLDKILLLNTIQEQNVAMVVLTMLTQGYIWESHENPATIIPEIIGNNLENICKSMQRFPILSYRDYVLHNWHLKDPNQGITLDNVEPIITLTGTEDEKWFIKIHLAIEATCAPAIRNIYEACLLNFEMNHNMFLKNIQNELRLIDLLTDGIALPLREATKILLKMKDHCNPEIFYHKLRPLLSGWDEKLSIIFSGNLKTIHLYKGPSGAQSSILPALDEALGIKHQVDGMFQHLLTFKQYMPLKHQHFINLLKLRNIQLKPSSSNELITALNNTIEEVKRFRYMHLYAMVGRFIYKPAAKQGISADSITGTGGTPLGDYLSDRLNDTHLPKAKL